MSQRVPSSRCCLPLGSRGMPRPWPAPEMLQTVWQVPLAFCWCGRQRLSEELLGCCLQAGSSVQAVLLPVSHRSCMGTERSSAGGRQETVVRGGDGAEEALGKQR